MKALFIGGALNAKVIEVPPTGPKKYRHYRRGGDHAYDAYTVDQPSTGHRWLVYIRGPVPPPEVVGGLIEMTELPTLEAQRNDE
jgi:hypothetical protein